MHLIGISQNNQNANNSMEEKNEETLIKEIKEKIKNQKHKG